MSVRLTVFGRSSWAPAGYEPSTEAMKLGQQLHQSRAPNDGPRSGFLGTVQVQFLDKVYKLVEVPAAQVTAESPAPVIETVVSHGCDRLEFVGFLRMPFLDKVADMPIVVQPQFVDKVVDFPVFQVEQFFSRCPS